MPVQKPEPAFRVQPEGGGSHPSEFRLQGADPPEEPIPVEAVLFFCHRSELSASLENVPYPSGGKRSPRRVGVRSVALRPGDREGFCCWGTSGAKPVKIGSKVWVFWNCTKIKFGCTGRMCMAAQTTSTLDSLCMSCFTVCWNWEEWVGKTPEGFHRLR